MAQFCIEHGYDSEAEAEAAVPELAARLMRQLKADGYASFTAPDVPNMAGVRAYVQGSYRVVSQYVLPWLPSQWAHKFVVRVDTLAEKT